jgi:hypothetical protein
VTCGAAMIFRLNSKRNSETSFVRLTNDFCRVGRVFETHQNHEKKAGWVWKTRPTLHGFNHMYTIACPIAPSFYP